MRAPSDHGKTTILACLLVTGVLLNGPATAQEQDSFRHPLDSLSKLEIEAAVDVLREAELLPPGSLLISLDLVPPPKDLVRAWKRQPVAAKLPRRMARAVLRFDRKSKAATVDLAAGSLTSTEEIRDGQVAVTEAEVLKTMQAVFTNEGMRRGLERRGVESIGFHTLFCAPRTVGNFGERREQERRIVKADCFDLRDNPTNVFAAPIEGLFATIDLDTGEVLDVVDQDVVPIPRGRHALAATDQPATRQRSRLQQPAVAPESIIVRGSAVSWERWRLHLSWNTHAGLVLGDVEYKDGNESRSILYEGHLSELYVPYMDPTIGWYYRNYFDEGEYGLGTTATALARGKDCPTNALYISPWMADVAGAPSELTDRVCVFERSTGEPTWRHYDLLSQRTESREDRDLVVRTIATVGNYDYLFDWILDAKGRITFRAGATGVDAVKAVRAKDLTAETADEDTKYGPLVAAGLAGIQHDHFFSLRLDVDIDGAANRFVLDEFYVEEQPSDSPRSSIWRTRERLVANERNAQFQINLRRPSLWRIQSATKKNVLGYPTSYQLRPGVNALPLVDPDDPPLARAAFANHHLWITRYHPEQRWAAGEFPNQSRPGEGLPAWTRLGRSIEDQDVVLWYTMGFHHVPSTEDWPVYNVGWHTVTLAPYNFFDQNPALDLPD